MRILAADLGGTRLRLLLAEYRDGAVSTLHEETSDSTAHEDLGAAVAAFLRGAGAKAPEHACFAVAGPVIEEQGVQRARITNLPWRIDARHLARQLDIRRLRLVNDFQAAGLGIEALSRDELATLQAGRPGGGAPRVILGAGTGLGEALLVPGPRGYEALPSEGGHVDFAPRDGEQWALLRFLRREFAHVSCEHLLSGPGLVRICRFLLEESDEAPSPELRAALEREDPAPALSTLALAGGDPLARRTLDLFIRIYGAHAGNLGLTALARGGVYLAGGIAPAILERLRDGPFLEAFCAKGRMSELAATLPVHVILTPRAGLLGAALAAARP